jgi:glucosamine-6-phosphate deaminase
LKILTYAIIASILISFPLNLPASKSIVASNKLMTFITSKFSQSNNDSDRSDSYTPDTIEQYFLDQVKSQPLYPTEHIPIIETKNTNELGKLTVLSFLKWVHDNPTGVVAISTDTVSVLFIKHLRYYKRHWHEPIVQEELEKIQFPTKNFPSTRSLKIVQLSEFFPINTSLNHSLYNYFKKYFVQILGIKKKNLLNMEEALVPTLKQRGIENVFVDGKIDITLLTRAPKNHDEIYQIEAIKEISTFIKQYESTLKKWGGIGLLLTGIGNKGHIIFNSPGTFHNSTTRLVQLDYPLAAAASQAFGGIEYSRHRHGITIGLSTLLINKDLEVIIYASEPKTRQMITKVAKTKKPDINYPATCFFKAAKFRFYVTSDIAQYMPSRRHMKYLSCDNADIPSKFIEEEIISLALSRKKPIVSLTKKDFKSTDSTYFLYKRLGKSIHNICFAIQNKFISKIEKNVCSTNPKKILHTSPHHEDIILSYYPIVKQLINTSMNQFCVYTNGYQNVANNFLMQQLQYIKDWENCYDKIEAIKYTKLLDRFKETFNATSTSKKKRIETMIIAKKIIENMKITNKDDFNDKIDFLLSYIDKRFPGQADSRIIQNLKGYIRETEEERTWYSCCGIPIHDIYHLRSNFFSFSPFTSPNISEIDIKKLSSLIDDFSPEIITVPVDYSYIKTDVYYKCLKTLSQSLEILSPTPSPKIWGYHNIRHSFNFIDANLFYFTTEEEMNEVEDIFNHCYSTQKGTPFPVNFFNGSFTNLMKTQQKNALRDLKILLGENYFKYHPHKIIKNCKGLILLKEMTTKELIEMTKNLQEQIEITKSSN